MRTGLFFDRRMVASMIAVVGGLSYALLIVSAVTAEDYAFAGGGLLGGDHLAFWTAARAALSGAWTDAYDPDGFRALMGGSGVGEGTYGLTWQYPPHAALFLAPFGALPYHWSWVVWSALSLAAFAAALRLGAMVSWRIVGLALLSPISFQVVVTGQTGALVGAALICALLPDRRPVLAGVCAGLLTMKPQLGLLLPVAYLAGGHLRAFWSAAATASVLASASVVWLGPDAWPAFGTALFGVGAGVDGFPLSKMVTVFAALRCANVPPGAALAVQIAALVFAASLTFRLWRSGASPEARASLTACLLFLTTPYAYYYDLPVLALPFLFVLGRIETPAPGLRALLYGLWIVPLFVVSAGAYGAYLGLGAVLLLTLITLRTAAPQTRLGLAPV